MLAQGKNISGMIQRKQVKVAASGKGERGSGIWDGMKTDFHMYTF